MQANRIAVPRFNPELLARGHAVHFRCQSPGVEELRIDIMTRLRDLADFELLWERRTVFEGEGGVQFHLLSVPDLVIAKKTQRTRDWPIIELLASIHHRENAANPRADWVDFWLRESRTAELVLALVDRFPKEAAILEPRRPVLAIARSASLDELRTALDAEMRAEQAKDRAYWEPLRKELEQFGLAERRQLDS